MIAVKDHVDSVSTRNDEIILRMDCVDESIKCFIAHEFSKDNQAKQIKKLFDEWTQLKKLAKDIKKEISPMVQNEKEKNNNNIKKLEEDLKIF